MWLSNHNHPISWFFYCNILMLCCLWNYITCRGTAPSPRFNHVAALYDDKILYIFGGSSKSRTLNDLYSLDFETVSELCRSKCVNGLYRNNMQYNCLISPQCKWILHKPFNLIKIYIYFFRWHGHEWRCEVFIRHLELVVVVSFVVLNGISQVVEAGKKVCFIMEKAFVHDIKPAIYLCVLNVCYVSTLE